MPPEAPPEVATYIESSLVYQNSANYEMAIHSLELARKEWYRINNPEDKKDGKDQAGATPVKVKAPEDPKKLIPLRPEQELYF